MQPLLLCPDPTDGGGFLHGDAHSIFLGIQGYDLAAHVIAGVLQEDTALREIKPVGGQQCRCFITINLIRAVHIVLLFWQYSRASTCLDVHRLSGSWQPGQDNPHLKCSSMPV